jgi:hypothetical protein
MLRVAQDEFGDADSSRFADRFAEQCVGAFAAFCRYEVVRRLEIPVVDFLRLDEIDDVDRSCFLERRRLEILFRQDDEATLLVLVALDEIFPRARTSPATCPLHGAF